MSKDFEKTEQDTTLFLENKLEELMKVNYQVLLQKNGENFTLIIPELNLIAKALDLISAYQNLENRKKELFVDYIKIGATELLPLPSKQLLRPRTKSIRTLIAKLAIFGVLLLVVVQVLSISIKGKVNSVKEQLFDIDNKISFANDIAQRLQKTEPEKRQELLSSLRIITNELKPFANEVRSIFTGDEK